MKKSSILLIFFLFFNGSFFQPTLDTENIKIDLKRSDDEKILVKWSIDFERYDDIIRLYFLTSPLRLTQPPDNNHLATLPLTCNISHPPPTHIRSFVIY